jgi:transcriptional regulator with XRE-family HTH domain
MPRTGLSEIENGGRRVTVDDLMALAVALDVTPNDLLLPWDDSQGPEEATALGSVTPKDVWPWADGIAGPPNDLLAGDTDPAERARPQNLQRRVRSEALSDRPPIEELIRMLKHTGQRTEIIYQWVKEWNDAAAAAETDTNGPADGHD